MGMFDYIKYEMDCPKCGERVNGFQSKDGSCCLAELEYWEVSNFCDSCENCGAWIEFNRKKPTQSPPIKDYEMTVSKGE